MQRAFAVIAISAVVGLGFAVKDAKAVVVTDSNGACIAGGAAVIHGNTFPQFPAGDLSHSSSCSGLFSAGITVVGGAVSPLSTPATPGSAQALNEFEINELAFDGETNWKLAEEISLSGSPIETYSNDNLLGLSVTKTNGSTITGAFYPTGGLWSLDNYGEATKAAIVLMGEKFSGPLNTPTDGQWGIYLIDMTKTAGAWSFVNGFDPHIGANAGKPVALRSFQVYLSTEVPVPAALPMLLTGLAGLVAFKRRKRAV